MEEKSSLQLFGAVAQLQAELHLLKVKKLDAYIRPLFAKHVACTLCYVVAVVLILHSMKVLC